MNNEAIKEVLNELFSHLERLETQSEAILQFLKERKRVTDKQLAPHLEQAGNASSVKWRAARVRINHLLDPEHPEKEIKLGKKPELHEAPARAESSDADSVTALVGDEETESSDKDGKLTEPGDTGLQEKEKSEVAKSAQARPAEVKPEKPEEKQKNVAQAAQDQHAQKSDSIHHPTEATAELATQEGVEPAAQLKPKEEEKRKRGGLGFISTLHFAARKPAVESHQLTPCNCRRDPAAESLTMSVESFSSTRRRRTISVR